MWKCFTLCMVGIQVAPLENKFHCLQTLSENYQTCKWRLELLTPGSRIGLRQLDNYLRLLGSEIRCGIHSQTARQIYTISPKIHCYFNRDKRLALHYRLFLTYILHTNIILSMKRKKNIAH